MTLAVPFKARAMGINQASVASATIESRFEMMKVMKAIESGQGLWCQVFSRR